MSELLIIKVCPNNYRKCTQTKYIRSIDQSNRIFQKAEKLQNW